MEINSNSRNKPTANWISNKNAIASNNVSFVSNVVSWLCWLLKNNFSTLKLPYFETFCLLFFFFFFSPHHLLSAWWLATCRSTNHSRSIPLDQRFVSEGPRRRIWSTIFHLHTWKNPDASLFLHYSCIRLVCICCLWHVDIAVQCCHFSVFSKMLQWFEEENIQNGHILAGHTSGRFADRGVLIQYNVMRRRSTAIRGRGEVKKSSPHGAKDLLFSSSSFVLLWGLGRRALRLAVLSGGGFAAPGGVVAQSRGAVEVVLVIQAVSGVVLRVLQTRDQTLILVSELAAHQGRLADHHHVLGKGKDRERNKSSCL